MMNSCGEVALAGSGALSTATRLRPSYVRSVGSLPGTRDGRVITDSNDVGEQEEGRGGGGGKGGGGGGE